jgi:hypothetical protein
MRGRLLDILVALPSSTVLRDRTRTWSLSALIESIRNSEDDGEYLLFSRKDGQRAIVRLEGDGSLAKSARYLEVSPSRALQQR